MKRMPFFSLALVIQACIVAMPSHRLLAQADSAITVENSTTYLPAPLVTENALELCLNSRYSQHSLKGTANNQHLSNILWAAGRTPITGTHRDIYVATRTGTYLYHPNDHTLTWHSGSVTNDGAFALIYDSELDFDSGVSFMPALLASVALGNSPESPVASCPKGLGYPTARLIFGVQGGKTLTSTLVAHSSFSEGEPGWLPDPCTARDNHLEEVLADLNYISQFDQTDLTPQQISQILWAGYGCTDHKISGSNPRKAGLTVPSAWVNYYLTGTIYLVNESGAYRYHNRNPSDNNSNSTRDHRLESLEPSDTERELRSAKDTENQPASDLRGTLHTAVADLPQAPCYVIICLNSSQVNDHFARLETGFVAGSVLLQATALDLACHFKTGLTANEQSALQTITQIPDSHIPQAIVSIGPMSPPTGTAVDISVILPGRPDVGCIVPLTVRFFTPGANVCHDDPLYDLTLNAIPLSDGTAAVCTAESIVPGTYDISVSARNTLTSIRRDVVITEPHTPVDMGLLVQGDVNRDGIIDLEDYTILARNWHTAYTQTAFDARVDFDRNGLINAKDLVVLAGHWLNTSPVQVVP